MALPKPLPEPERLPKPRPEPTSAQLIRRLELRIRHRRAKLGPMTRISHRHGYSGSRIYGFRDLPDERDRYFTEADAERLFTEGLAAWHLYRGVTKRSANEFAFARAEAQILRVFANLERPPVWLPVVESDADGAPYDYRAAEAARRDAALAEADRRLALLEAELRKHPDDWDTWRGYRDVPLVTLSELRGIPLWTVQRSERRLIDRRVRRVWQVLFGEELPPELARRPRHDL
jgi:hypothetical protein